MNVDIKASEKYPLLAICLGGMEDCIAKNIREQCLGQRIYCEVLVQSEQEVNSIPHTKTEGGAIVFKGGAGCGKILLYCMGDVLTEWQWAYKVRSVQHWLLFLGQCAEIARDKETTFTAVQMIVEKIDFKEAFIYWLNRMSFSVRSKYSHLYSRDCEKNPSFCVRCIRDGDHEFNSVELAVKVGEFIISKTGWSVDLTTMDLEIVLLVMNERMVVGINMPTQSPPFLKSRIPGEIRPPVVHSNLSTSGLRASTAYVMGLLAKPKAGDILIDCMCGGGAGAIECAFSHKCLTLGGDIDTELVDGWQSSLKQLRDMSDGRAVAEMMHWSAHKLPLTDGSVDILIMDMYFGKIPKKIPRHYRAFIPRYVSEIARVLRPSEGRCVLLTQTTQQLVACLDSEYFDVKTTTVRWVNIGGLVCAFVSATRSDKLYTASASSGKTPGLHQPSSAADVVLGVKRHASELL